MNKEPSPDTAHQNSLTFELFSFSPYHDADDFLYREREKKKMKKNVNIYPITVVIFFIFRFPFHIHDVPGSAFCV